MKKWRVLTLAALLTSFTAPGFAMPAQAPAAQSMPTARARRRANHRQRRQRRHHRKKAARQLRRQRRAS